MNSRTCGRKVDFMACNLALGESDTGTEIPMSGASEERPRMTLGS